jgi:DMSO reductase family type II enzyme chaperone
MTASTVEAALCRSALWEALALGFRPPTPEAVARLATEDGAAGLVEAAEVAGGVPLAALVRQLAAADTAPSHLATAYHRLFGHTARGAVPLGETEYGADELFLQPQELADLGGFYAAFGLAVAPGAAERPDQVSCECEFMMFLARKEALALERGAGPLAEATQRAARLFLRDHLGRFVPALASRLAREDPDGFYGALGALAGAVVRTECGRVGVPAGAATLRVRVPLADRVPMACGTCPVGAPDAPGADGD